MSKIEKFWYVHGYTESHGAVSLTAIFSSTNCASGSVLGSTAGYCPSFAFGFAPGGWRSHLWLMIPGLVNIQKAIEHGHRNS